MHSVDEILHVFEKELPNLKILRTGEVFEFAGTRFLGDTMWVPKTPDLILSSAQVNDSRYIPHLLGEIGERSPALYRVVVQRASPRRHSNHASSPLTTFDPGRSPPVCGSTLVRGVRSGVTPCNSWPQCLDSWAHARTMRLRVERNSDCVNAVGYPNEAGKLPGRLAPFAFDL